MTFSAFGLPLVLAGGVPNIPSSPPLGCVPSSDNIVSTLEGSSTLAGRLLADDLSLVAARLALFTRDAPAAMPLRALLFTRDAPAAMPPRARVTGGEAMPTRARVCRDASLLPRARRLVAAISVALRFALVACCLMLDDST